MEKNRALRKSRKDPPSRYSSSLDERSNNLTRSSSIEDSFDSPCEKGMLISSSSSSPRISRLFCEQKRREFFATSRNHSSSSDRELQSSPFESNSYSFDSFITKNIFATLNPSDQEKVWYFLPSTIKEIDAILSSH